MTLACSQAKACRQRAYAGVFMRAAKRERAARGLMPGCI